jgi:hypothetical protein
VRTGRLLEPLRNRRPFLGAAEKPSLLTHGTTPSQNRDSIGMGEWRGRGEVR